MVNILLFNGLRSFVIKIALVTSALALVSCAETGVGPAAGGTMRRELLQPWIELSGAKPGTLLGQPNAALQGATGFITLNRPTAVSARGNDVYLIDSGLHRIFRYSRAEQTLTPFTNLVPQAGMSLYVAPDMSLYVTDPARSQVLHYTWDGNALPPLSSTANMGRPVSISVDESSGQLLLADAMYNQIIAFNSLGRPLGIIKPQHVRAIAAMAQGPDGIYVVDPLSRQVVVLGPDGSYRYAIGAGTLAEPATIAVERDNLVFVGDNFDQTVKVYRDGQLVSTVGGVGTAPGRFNNIAGLAVDGGLLYVADSMNARVQIMLINPQALNMKGK